jgi:hypothetical protein
VIALSSEAKLTPSSVSSELAGIIPNAITANIKLKTYLIDPLQPLILVSQRSCAGSGSSVFGPCGAEQVKSGGMKGM